MKRAIVHLRIVRRFAPGLAQTGSRGGRNLCEQLLVFREGQRGAGAAGRKRIQ